MKSHTHTKRTRVVCPECGNEFPISWNPKLRRFRAKVYKCLDCGFAGRKGMFDRPDWRKREGDSGDQP